MIKAELIHNPYLLETTVRFNGKEPRINCEIEKYEHQPLNLWVESIPKIFYNEMNGYDFELLFTGTKPDFDAVTSVFRKAGVTAKEVQITHKNELEDAYTKSDEIMCFLSWLSENRNKRFHYDQFWQDHASFFDDPYPMILVNGRDAKIEGIPLSVETVASVNELQNTDLASTPIVFYIDDASTPSRRTEIEKLLNRDDVEEKQLFFMFSQGFTTLQRERSIAELGIVSPQIIQSFEEESLKKYIEYYPIMEFIRTSFQLFRQIADSIGEELLVENRKSVVDDQEVHEEIARLDTVIVSLKAAEDFFAGRDNFIMPEEILAMKDDLSASISNWKNKKTKVVGETEIERMAVVLQYEVKNRFESYLTLVRDACLAKADEIKARFEAEYKKIENYDDYIPTVSLKKVYLPICPDIKTELLKLKEITFTEKPKDLFGGLFKKPDSESIETIRVVTSYFDQWRWKAIEMIIPLANRFMEGYKENLDLYYNELAREYSDHLHIMLIDNREKKDQAAAQLSGDARLLQIDNDWFSAFAEQLEHMEKG